MLFPYPVFGRFMDEIYEKYEFDQDDPASWKKFERPPHLDREWVREMRKIGGKIGEYWRFRVVWGYKEKVWMSGDGIPAGWYLKYMLGITEPRTVGYSWTDNGESRFAKRKEDVPSHILIAEPVIEQDQVGIPRWILEQYRVPGTPGNDHIDVAGYYFERQICRNDLPPNPDSNLHPYRDPDGSDLEILRGLVHLLSTLTKEDIVKGVASDRQRENAEAEAAHAEHIGEMTETIERTMRDMPASMKIPRPSKAVLDRAWKMLEEGVINPQRQQFKAGN